jgi:hypothetical protein
MWRQWNDCYAHKYGYCFSKLPFNNHGDANMVDAVDCQGVSQLVDTLERLGARHQADRLRQTLRGYGDDDQSPATSTHDSMPSLFVRAISLANSMTKWIAAGTPRRTLGEIEERLKICQACPHFINDHCQLCGCPCVERNQILNKLALATETCPVGKWK